VLNQQSQFSGLLAVSALFDIIWFTQNTQSAFIRLVTIIILIFKVNTLAQLFILRCSFLDKAPTFIAFSGTLTSRGVSGINLRGAEFGGTTGTSPKTFYKVSIIHDVGSLVHAWGFYLEREGRISDC